MQKPNRASLPLTLHRLLLFLGAVLVVACGGGADRGATPAAPATVRGDELPGRLLFVRQGVIWEWQRREARPLVGDGLAAQPAWAPDGERFVYVVRGNSFSDLVLAASDGATLAQLTENGSEQPPNSLARVYASRWAFYPTWAPGGREIVVATQAAPPEGDPPADYNLSLVLVPTGPGVTVPLYADGEAQCGRSVFAPDGATLVFTRAGTGAEGRQQLYRLDLASGTARPLPGAPEPSYDPAFSPDGRWLAFAARDGGRTDIFVLPGAAGGALQRLTTLGSARAPAFSPDGQQLAFLAVAPGEEGFDLWAAELQPADTGALVAGEPRRLTTGLDLDADSGLSWAP